MKNITRLLAAFLLICAPVIGFAASGAKVGVIDLQKVLEQSPQMQKSNEALKKQFKPQEDKIISAQKKLKADEDKLSGGSKLSASQQKKLEAKLGNEKKALVKQIAAFRQSLMVAHDKAMKSVLAQVKTVTQQVAKKQHLDMVMQKQGTFYADSSLDITDEVLAELKKKG